MRIHIAFLITGFLTISSAFSQNLKFDTLIDEIYRVSGYQKTQALELLDSLYRIAYRDRDSSLLAHCIYQEAVLNLRQGIVDAKLTQRIQNYLNRKHIPLYEQALLQSALGTSLMSEGKYSDAFSVQLQASEKYRQLNNSRFTAISLNALGNICQFINMLNLAEYYYSEAIMYITPEFDEYYSIKFNMFTIEAYFNKNETAEDSLIYLLDIVEKENREELLPMLYSNIGAYCLRQNYPERALSYFTKMQNLDFDSPKMLAWLYNNIGAYYLNRDNNSSALHYFKEAQKIMEVNNDYINLSVLYFGISLVFENQNQLDSALFYSRKNKELTERLHSNTIAIEMHQKYVTAYLETSKNELIIAEQKIALKNRQFVIIIIVSFFAVLLVLLFLLFVHQQKLRKTSENRELAAKLEHEKKVQQYEKQQQELEKEMQKEILDAKTREVTSYSLLVSNKNHILKQISELNEQGLNNKDDAVKTIKKVNRIIRSNLSTDNEWNNFKMHFDRVHPRFFEKLKQLSSDLTEENLKICAYAKMGMNAKQIAQLLNIADRSVVISRHRIKKKLNLPDDENLSSFIGNL